MIMNILHFTLLPSPSWTKSIQCQKKDGWTLAASDSRSKSRPTLGIHVVSSQNSDYSCLTSLSFLPRRVQVFLKTPYLSSILIWWQFQWEDPLQVLLDGCDNGTWWFNYAATRLPRWQLARISIQSVTMEQSQVNWGWTMTLASWGEWTQLIALTGHIHDKAITCPNISGVCIYRALIVPGSCRASL